MLEVKMRTLMLLLATVLLLTATSSTYAQEPAPPAVDQIEQLNLTPEQRQKIRMIFEENKAQRQMTTRRVREANIALDHALDAEPVDEALVEQRINDLAAAQAAQLRMRIQTEMKIRRELRPEQLATLRQLRLQVKDFRGVQRPLNQRPANQGFRPNRRNLPPR
jgi:Spy/CpxP family protein refolding chaperone